MSKPSRRIRRRSSLGVRPLCFVTSAILTAAAPARAQEAAAPPAGNVLEEVIVTSQKRAENLQAVPISIQAFDTKKLSELQVSSFDDYAKYLPSLSVQSFGPGNAQLYVRGVTNGGDGLKVGSQPLVGLYVDEMPVTTIANNLDIHIYDIARVEALSGPQGTLFGASSMAGTLRIITNKPDASKFEGGYDVTANTFSTRSPGGKIEGFVNMPLSEHAAVRLVGWSEYEGGYINNVRAPANLTYPTSGVVRDNPALVEKHYNWVETVGGRGALKLDLNDSWTVTPTLATQRQKAKGQFATTPYGVTVNGVTLPPSGDLNVSRYYPEFGDDKWSMATLTVQGKIADFDLLYAGGYLRRDRADVADYSDYSFFYDVVSGLGAYFHDNAGNLISPAQTTVTRNLFKKQSHELRISTPKDWRLRFVAGAFLQRQRNDTRDEYRVQNLSDAAHTMAGQAGSLDGEQGVLYLNSQLRTDRDSAVFTDLSFDLTDRLTLTGGIRGFHYDNTVYGFFGFGNSGYSVIGESQCFAPPTNPPNPERPCVNIDYRATKTSATHRLNLTFKIDPDRMMYATWSTGFRPGGVNRIQSRPPYTPDYLTNFELGWKTTWLEHRLRWNGALFFERWKDAQYGITGPNGITVLVNAGRSEIRGVESDVRWLATDGLTLSASATYLNAKLASNACNLYSADFSCSETGNAVLAPSGTRLPVSSKIKGNAIARYEFSAGRVDAHVQAAAVYQSDVIPSLTVSDLAVLGKQPAYWSLDLASGIAHERWTAELFVENVTDRRGEAYRFTSCRVATCRLINVVPIRPRLIGISFGQKF